MWLHTASTLDWNETVIQFSSHFFVSRQEMLQRAILTMTSGDCLKTTRISERCSRIFESSRSLIEHHSPWFLTDFSRWLSRLRRANLLLRPGFPRDSIDPGPYAAPATDWSSLDKNTSPGVSRHSNFAYPRAIHLTYRGTKRRKRKLRPRLNLPSPGTLNNLIPLTNANRCMW